MFEPRTIFGVVLLLVVPRSIYSLECYSCSDVSDMESCLNTSLCSIGQSCVTDSVTSGQITKFTLGCIDNQQCGTLASGASGLVGRDINVRATNCHECCSTERCNNQLCIHQKPTTCIDDVKVDCAYLNAMFNICQDTTHSKNVCPKFCGLCNLVDGNWAEWSQWSECDVTCESGIQTRKRTCTNPAPANKGLDCVGNNTDTKPCVKQPCPIHGGWTKWSEWEACSVTCDTGIQRRHRNCSSPYPSLFGNHCFGDTLDDRICMVQACANGGWTTWGSWTSCSTSCGVGIRSKARSCTNPLPSPHGKFCNGESVKVATCNTETCVPNVAFSVYHLTDLSPAIGEIMTFKTILLNDGNRYNPSTGVFTAPVNGTYSFSAQICITGGNYLKYAIKVGSTMIANTFGYDASSVNCFPSQVVAFVRKHETVTVKWTYLGSTNTIYDSNDIRNYFSGVLNHL